MKSCRQPTGPLQEHPALPIHAAHAAHSCESVKQKNDENHIHHTLIPVGGTGELQPVHLSENGSSRNYCFCEWYTDQVAQELQEMQSQIKEVGFSRSIDDSITARGNIVTYSSKRVP